MEGAEDEAVSQSAIWSLGSVSVSFEFCVSLAYWLGLFTFVALFPYMLDVIRLLNSENIIKRLAVEITRDKILNSKEDPIQPIVAIIHGSIMKNDLETTRVGLKAVTDRVIKNIGSNSEEKISKLFCEHLERVGRLAISREDEESTLEVIENLENFGTSTAEKKLETATVVAVWSLKRVAKAAAGKELEDAISQVAKSLGKVGTAAAGKGFENATLYAVWLLENVGKAAAEKATVGKGLENATVNAVRSLVKVGKAAAGKGLENATQQAAGSLARLTIFKENLKAVIQDYVSKDEIDQEAFHKFIKIYEQKLEKLRALE